MQDRTKISRPPLMRIMSRLLWIIASAAIGVLLFSYLLPQDLSRNTPIYSRFVQISFFGRVLTFHLSMLLLFIAIVALLIRKRWLVFFAGAFGLIALSPTLIVLLPHQSHSALGPTIRIMSMNLKYTHSNSELFIDQVKQYQPDVLVVQDYTPYAQRELSRAFGTDYPYRFMQPNTLQGLAIYSRRPFVGGPPVATFSKIRRQMRAVIDVNSQSFVVYVEHPYSPRTRQRIINNRIATVDLARQIHAETLPTIVAGDFNFTQSTPNEDAIEAAGFTDGFELVGHGRGSTWPVEPRWMQWLPGVRIDHIFVSHQMTCTAFFVGGYDGSDHLPIVADVGVRQSR